MKRMAWMVLLFASGPAFGQTIQQQVDACAQLSICKLDVPSGVTVVNQPWNLRDKTALSIKGQAGATVIWHFASDPPPTLCIDTTGTRDIHIDSVTFSLGNTSKRPDVLWIHGRGADGKSQTRLAVEGCQFSGWFTRATVAFIAVENEELHSVGFTNNLPNTTALFLSRSNELGLTSPFGPTRTGATFTSTNHSYYNCSFNHAGHVGLVAPANNDGGFGLTLGTGVHDLLIQGGSTSGGPRGGVLHILGPTNRRVVVAAPNWESQNALSTIVIDGEVAGLAVYGGLLQALGPAVRVNGAVEHLTLQPAEMLTEDIIRFGPTGKVTGRGLSAWGVSGQ